MNERKRKRNGITVKKERTVRGRKGVYFGGQ